MWKLVHKLAFGTRKFHIAPYDKINHRLVNLSCNCDVKLGFNLLSFGQNYSMRVGTHIYPPIPNNTHRENKNLTRNFNRIALGTVKTLVQ